MYTDFNSQDDEFNKMQEKIKDTIESMVTNSHICNTTANSYSVENTENKYF